MELFIAGALGLILAETTYLTYRQSNINTTKKNDILIDTSVLIDGRIVAIARSGLVSARLIVPRSVVRELQFMADKADHDKRERARFGLEVIEKLQELPDVDVEVRDDGSVSEHGVDEQLIILAQRSGAKLCTIDYNLNKAARVQSVEIININELAHALRVVHLPGEKISVELVQPGQDKKQAVGYLDDGTMVVVDDSRELIGQTTDVELTRVLQTAAGRMMFAKRLSAKKVSHDTDAHRARPPKTAKPVATQSPGEASSQSQGATRNNSSATNERPQNARRGSGRARRATPEDTLVDLANK